MCLASLALKSSKEICLPFPSKFRWRIFAFLEQRGRKVETDKALWRENCGVFRCRPGLCVRGRLRTLNSCHLFFLGIQANVLGASLSSTGPGRTPLHRAFVSRPLGTKGLGFGVIFFSCLGHAEMLLLIHSKTKQVCQFLLFVACWHFWKDTRRWGLRDNYCHK